MDKQGIEKYLPIIKDHYPDIALENIRIFQDGYDHDVLLVNQDQAFRFPRTQEQEKIDQVENVFLNVFAKTSPIPVQNMSSHAGRKTGIRYQTYKFIHGIQLSKKIVQTLSDEELASIAVDMGKFLTTLHSFPLAQARAMKMDELDPRTYWKYFEDLLEKMRVAMFPLLSKDEQHWIEKMVKDYVTIAKNFKVKVTHSDLLAEHIIVDEKTHRLNGVIDFSLRIADPAYDFQFFDRYGNLFLQTLYKNYLPVDERFDQRRKFYAGYVPLVNLYESIEKKDKTMTEVHLTELREYISS